MSEDFIRYYFGDIHFEMLQNVQRESGKFNEWELIRGSDFDRKNSYGYLENVSGHLHRNQELLYAISKISVIAENKTPQNVKPSILWEYEFNINDILSLLSIACGRHYSTLAVEKRLGDKYTISLGLITNEITGGRWDIVSISKLGKFVSEALTFLEKNPSWLDKSGFVPSIYWFTQAQMSCNIAPSVLEMGLYWVSIEIIAGTYINSNGLNIKTKKERVKRFINDSGYKGDGWGFLDDMISDWYKIRSAGFHEGKEKLPMDVLIRRRQQVRDFTSLVFVEMLQPQGGERQKEIAKRMKSY